MVLAHPALVEFLGKEVLLEHQVSKEKRVKPETEGNMETKEEMVHVVQLVLPVLLVHLEVPVKGENLVLLALLVLLAIEEHLVNVASLVLVVPLGLADLLVPLDTLG